MSKFTEWAAIQRFARLGVQVKDGQVSTFGGLVRRDYGPLAGAQAVVTNGANVHRVKAGLAAGAILGPVGLLTALPKKAKATALVVFADGTVHERKLDGNAAVRAAQAEAVRFNALAANAPPAETVPPRTGTLAEKAAAAQESTAGLTYSECKPGRDAFKAARRAGLSHEEARQASREALDEVRRRKAAGAGEPAEGEPSS